MMTNRLRGLATGLPSTPMLATIFCSLRFCSAQPQETDSDGSDLDNDSANHSASCSGPWSHGGESTWDDRYRRRANEVVFGREKVYRHDHGDEKRQRVLAKALLEAAIDVPDEEIVAEEHQKSLAVGIIGAPNAGKSALTNFMVSLVLPPFTIAQFHM